MADASRPPRVVVAQLGARRHYLVPRALARRGMLDRFYTDLYLNRRWLATLVRGTARIVPWGLLKRWSNRIDSSLDPRRVVDFPLLALRYKQMSRHARTGTEHTAAYLWAGRKFCRQVCRRGFGSADAVFAYTSAALEIFEEARRRNLICILDHATAPKLHEDALVSSQEARYPGWSDAVPSTDTLAAAYAARQRDEWQLADVIVCNSSFVKNAIASEGGPGERCVVVPLGLGGARRNPTDRRGRIGPLRVLFVGDDAVRKGIGDLASAVQLIGRDKVHARVVGNVRLSAQGRREAGKSLELIGPIPRLEMDAQYAWADVFVLPSASDTFALTVLEAMQAGLPVIVTPNVGAADAVRDGVDGFIVPVASPKILAEKLELLSVDRDCAARMGVCAAVRVTEFDEDRYAEALAGLISQVVARTSTAMVNSN